MDILIIDTDTLSTVFTASEIACMSKSEARSTLFDIAAMVEAEAGGSDAADVRVCDATGRTSTRPRAHEIFEAVLIGKADEIRARACVE